MHYLLGRLVASRQGLSHDALSEKEAIDYA
jgi:hypothetical protein